MSMQPAMNLVIGLQSYKEYHCPCWRACMRNGAYNSTSLKLRLFQNSYESFSMTRVFHSSGLSKTSHLNSSFKNPSATITLLGLHLLYKPIKIETCFTNFPRYTDKIMFTKKKEFHHLSNLYNILKIFLARLLSLECHMYILPYYNIIPSTFYTLSVNSFSPRIL